MSNYIKNIEHEQVLDLKELMAVATKQVVSRTLCQNEHVSLTLFSFDQGEEISTHSSSGDALVTILEGTARITIDSQPFIVEAGKSIVMPANKPHALYAKEAFKMQLTVIFKHDGGVIDE